MIHQVNDLYTRWYSHSQFHPDDLMTHSRPLSNPFLTRLLGYLVNIVKVLLKYNLYNLVSPRTMYKLHAFIVT